MEEKFVRRKKNKTKNCFSETTYWERRDVFLSEKKNLTKALYPAPYSWDVVTLGLSESSPQRFRQLQTHPSVRRINKNRIFLNERMIKGSMEAVFLFAYNCSMYSDKQHKKYVSIVCAGAGEKQKDANKICCELVCLLPSPSTRRPRMRLIFFLRTIDWCWIWVYYTFVIACDMENDIWEPDRKRTGGGVGLCEWAFRHILIFGNRHSLS